MALEQDVRNLLASLLVLEPWARVLEHHGVSSTTDFFSMLSVDRTVPGFGDFCDAQAMLIRPGDPARSLLYHCLASPNVQPEGLQPRDYPTLAQIDLVENFVYSLISLTEKERNKLVPAVFAYEYRQAASTPHGQHADLVFSRIGIARIGNAPALYDPVQRCHIHGAGAAHEVRSIPARYAAFLCERVKGSAMDGRRLGAAQFADSNRTFLVPVAKLFNGQKLGKCDYMDVSLSMFHLTDRLRRLFTIGQLHNIDQADLDRPPFVRTTRNGGLDVQVSNLGASVLVASAAQPLVRQVVVSAGNSAGQVRRGMTEVPPKGKGIDAFNENRRYSTLRVGQALFTAGIDYVGSKITGSLTDTRLFLSPRNCPEFINMRHRVISATAPVEDLNLSITDPDQFTKTLNEGRYLIALYLDDICDGYVKAQFQDSKGLSYAVAPAFSVITAPDFFPCIGSLDIAQFADNFKDGGPSPLCEGRLRTNTRMRDPDTDAPIFNRDDTLAAAVSMGARAPSGGEHKMHPIEVTTALTDGASNVFAPGWDVTYGRDSVFSSPYYHTAGLGSPFVEDAKLCAAANGMWAAASPDAARTFKASRTPTAIPLTDAELGLHPDHPAARATGESFRGWDGEFGPFVEMIGRDVVVNVADIMRSDYVSNALRNLLRFDKLRTVSKAEMVTRLKALRAVIEHLDGADAKVSDTGRWLVVFQQVLDWGNFRLDHVLPVDAVDRYPTLSASVAAWSDRGGYVFGFANRGIEVQRSDDPARLIAPLASPIVFALWRETDGALAVAQ